MAPKPRKAPARSKTSRTTKPVGSLSPGFGPPLPVSQPQFAEAQATPEPAKFLVRPGSTRSTRPQSLVADKMVSDFDEMEPKEVPAFYYQLGDVAYRFGESAYYYDQFYDAYRHYPAPIFAIPGNHDGMASPLAPAGTVSLAAFCENFCSETLKVGKDAGGLPRTAMQQPGAFFTLEASFLRILRLYNNRLESPGVIAAPAIGNSQLDFLDAALARAKKDLGGAALLVAVHHPAYASGGTHPGSPDMLKQIDAVCTKAGMPLCARPCARRRRKRAAASR